MKCDERNRHMEPCERCGNGIKIVGANICRKCKMEIQLALSVTGRSSGSIHRISKSVTIVS